MSSPCRVVVLISGKGSNLQALIDAGRESGYPAQIVAVISNKADAYGLQRARLADIPTAVLESKDYSDRAAYDRALMQLIDNYQPDLIVLAGFMRILSDEFVEHYAGHMLNIHPSLLPRYKGLNTHQRVLEAGDRQHGASVHLVTPALDDGPVILQSRIAVLPEDTAESLAQRVHAVEHQIYPRAIRWFAEGRLRFEGDAAYLDNKLISTDGT